MRKIKYTILIALVTAGAGYLVKYLEEERNRKLVFAQIKKYSAELDKKAKPYLKKLDKKTKPYLSKLDKKAKSYAKQAKKLYAKKLKEYEI